MSIYKRRTSRGRSRSFTAEFWHRGQLYRRSGFVDREHAEHWLMSEKLRLRRGETGYTKTLTKADVSKLIGEFIDHLRSRGNDDMYVYTAEKRLHRLAAECGWRLLGHVTAASLDAWKASGSTWRDKPIGARTINQYIQIAQEWGKWLHRPAAKLPANPLADVLPLRAKHNNAYRRAATAEELDKLLATCPKERRLYYLFRIYTPLRGRTIAGLTWGMMHLDASPPFVRTPAELNKSRKEEKHVIRYDIAQELRAEKKARKARASDLVFADGVSLSTLRGDLHEAGVAFDDGKGNRRLDFHALRRTLIRLAKNAGLTLDQASLLLGHKSSATTRKWYDDDMVEPSLGDAVEKLPGLGRMRRAE